MTDHSERNQSTGGTTPFVKPRDAEPDVAPERPAPQRRWYSDPLLLSILVVAFAADQFSKTLIVRNLRLSESWPSDGFFRLTYARNTGTAFGLFQDQAMILTVVSFVAVAAIIYFYRNAMTSPLMRAALGLQLGGAFGNLIDRVRLGYVVDFIDVGPWPIFNLADSSIVVGIAILAWHFAFRHDPAHGVESGTRFDSAPPVPPGGSPPDVPAPGDATRQPDSSARPGSPGGPAA
ncbi:MAG: signal peptidase II [Chloroflexi bacterium]|nr:signal peptidase II [Chloroflexota bacterium]